MRFIVFAILSIGLMEAVRAEPASSQYDLPKVVAVQNRAYQVKNELTLQGGYLPTDAFNKGFPIGASYTHFFSDYFGWEVINANYSFNSETNLKNDLQDCCQLQVENVGFDGVLDYIEWYAITSLVYTPLYTKALLFNKEIIRGEISFVAGGGSAKFKATGAKALFSAGLYVRFFSRENRSWKFDFRNNVYFENSLGAVNAMSLMVGYAFHFGAKAPSKPLENLDEL